MKISSKIKLFSPTDNLDAISKFADALSKGGATPRSIVNANPAFFDNDDLAEMEERQKAELEIDKMRYADNNDNKDQTSAKIGFTGGEIIKEDE